MLTRQKSNLGALTWQLQQWSITRCIQEWWYNRSRVNTLENLGMHPKSSMTFLHTLNKKMSNTSNRSSPRASIFIWTSKKLRTWNLSSLKKETKQLLRCTLKGLQRLWTKRTRIVISSQSNIGYFLSYHGVATQRKECKSSLERTQRLSLMHPWKEARVNLSWTNTLLLNSKPISTLAMPKWTYFRESTIWESAFNER